MSDRLEQRINVVFCVKLGENENNICAVLFEVMGGSYEKIQVLLSDISSSKRSRMLKSEVKTMLINFFVTKRFVQFKFIPRGQTVNQAYYVEILKQLHEAVRRKRLNFCPNFGFSAMTMLVLTRHFTSGCFWLKNRLLKNKHPFHSPYYAPNDFWLFTEIKSALEGRIFQDI
jgi:hypothetical protein